MANAGEVQLAAANEKAASIINNIIT